MYGTAKATIITKTDSLIALTSPAHAKGLVRVYVWRGTYCDSSLTYTYAYLYGCSYSPTSGDTAGGTLQTYTASYGLGTYHPEIGGHALTGWTATDSAHGSGRTARAAAGVDTVKMISAAPDTVVVGVYQYTAGIAKRRHGFGFGWIW
jgi:hypothetical protein